MPASPDDFQIARRQYIKAKRNETRIRYSLMADAEIARALPQWGLEFDAQFRTSMPQVLDLHSELRRLTAGAPLPEDPS